MPMIERGAYTEWVPSFEDDAIGSLEVRLGVARHDDEDLRSLRRRSEDVRVRCHKLRALIDQALEMHDAQTINLPTWWILDANQARGDYR